MRRIGELLHEQFDQDVCEPPPQRWVDLILYLNEQEKAKNRARPERN